MTDAEQFAPAPMAGPASGLSIAALVLGITGVCCPPLAIVACVLGLVEWTNINKGKAAQAGYGLALAGWILGLMTTLGWGFILFLNVIPFLALMPFLMTTGP